MSRIIFTKHALEMLTERKLPRELVESTVLSPEWKDSARGDVWFAFKRVGSKVLRVVVKGKYEPYTVITMHFDRRLK